MNLNEFVKKSFEVDEYLVRPRIVCIDGFSMSVQGNKYDYCIPRKLSDKYDSMEIGFPSEKQPELMEFAENENDPTGTVYGYVPIELIHEVVEKHGGIDEEKTFA